MLHIPLSSPRLRLPILISGMACLLLGVAGGLWRLGLEIPLPDTQPATFHGALMVAAFFGTVIGLERAVESGSRLAFLAPFGAATGGLAMAFGLPGWLSGALLAGGALVFALLGWRGWKQQGSLPSAVALGGALCLLGANGLWWWGWLTSELVGLWFSFLLLTITAERMELTPGAPRCFALLAATTALGAMMLPFHWRTGTAVMGVALVLLAICLLRLDPARSKTGASGLSGFTARCLVSGYVWLGIGGALLPFAGPAGPHYDAALHALLLGFVFAMVFGHAPLVFPGIIGRPMAYSPLFFSHLLALQASLLLCLAGDLLDKPDWRLWGGIGNAITLALFLTLTARALLQGNGSTAPRT